MLIPPDAVIEADETSRRGGRSSVGNGDLEAALGACSDCPRSDFWTVGSADGAINIYNPHPSPLRGHTAAATVTATSSAAGNALPNNANGANGTITAKPSSANTAKVVVVRQGGMHSCPVEIAEWSPDGEFLVTADGTGNLVVWCPIVDTATKSPRRDAAARQAGAGAGGQRQQVGADFSTKASESASAAVSKLRRETSNLSKQSGKVFGRASSKVLGSVGSVTGRASGAAAKLKRRMSNLSAQ